MHRALHSRVFCKSKSNAICLRTMGQWRTCAPDCPFFCIQLVDVGITRCFFNRLRIGCSMVIAVLKNGSNRRAKIEDENNVGREGK